MRITRELEIFTCSLSSSCWGHFLRFAPGVTAWLFALGFGVSAQETVYDNTGTFTGSVASFSFEGTTGGPTNHFFAVGDLVNLPSQFQTIGEVSLILRNERVPVPRKAFLQLRFYETFGDITVGALIVPPIALSEELRTGEQTIVWTGLNVRVPRQVIVVASMAVTIQDPEPTILGFPFFNPPVVGTSDNDFHYSAVGLGLPPGPPSIRSNAGNHNLGWKLVTRSPAVTLEAPVIRDGLFQGSFEAELGRTYRIDARSGFSEPWLPLTNLPPKASTLRIFTDPWNGSESRYYRAVRLP